MAGFLGKLKSYGQPLKAYERHLSAVAMIGGFIFDCFAYGRLDHAVTQTILLVYITVATGTILLLHYLEAHPQVATGGRIWGRVRLRGVLPAVIQFAFGTLWSAFLVFYARSAVFAATWPFFILLVAVFVINEVLRTYHSRLIFTSVLLSFALLSYAIFMVPVFTHSISQPTFIYSGLAAGGVFLLFLVGLRLLGKQRWQSVHWSVLRGAGAVFATVYGLYFAGLLPPLPLAMQKAGVYSAVWRSGAVYYAIGEPQSWDRWFGAPDRVHVGNRGTVYVFSAIFAPIKLSTRVQHIWQHYEPSIGWVTVQKHSYRIFGGRKNGYRGYTKRSMPEPGLWQVDVETSDGRLIGRTRFTVSYGKSSRGAVTSVIR